MWIRRSQVCCTHLSFVYVIGQCCPVRKAKEVGLNPIFWYNEFVYNTLLSKGDSSHGAS